MLVVFLDPRLAAIRTADAGKTGLPAEVIASCQRRLLFLDAVPDERTLKNWRSLGYLTAENGERSIRLGDSWRLVFVLDGAKAPPTIQVRSIVNHHQPEL